MLTPTLHQIAARKRARRIRALSSVGLVLAIAVTVTRYVIQIRASVPSTEDLIPGSEAARARAVSILIGSFGESMVEGWRFVQQPGVQAGLIIAVVAAATLLCFRIARLIELYAGDSAHPPE